MNHRMINVLIGVISNWRTFFSLNALAEVTITAILSLVPLLASGLVFLERTTAQPTYNNILDMSFGGGQLFLYCFSIISVILWILLSDAGRISRILIGPLALFALIYIAILLGVDPSLSRLNNSDIIVSSYYIYSALLVLHYLLLALTSSSGPSPEEIFKKGVYALDQRVEERRNA